MLKNTCNLGKRGQTYLIFNNIYQIYSISLHTKYKYYYTETLKDMWINLSPSPQFLSLKVNCDRNYNFVIHFLFFVPQKKESHTGLEQHELFFWGGGGGGGGGGWTVPLKAPHCSHHACARFTGADWPVWSCACNRLLAAEAAVMWFSERLQCFFKSVDESQ